jgi:hypothetical protein
MSESQSTPEQGAAESSNPPVSKAKPILRSKDSSDREPSSNREPSDKPQRGGDRERGKAKGKGRDRGERQEPQAKVNAALMRGPRPTQPKPAPEPVVEEEPVSDEGEMVEAVSDETVEVAAEAE